MSKMSLSLAPVCVQKYGGSSLATPERMHRVAEHIKRRVEQGQSLVVVVSAMGRSTDELLALASEVSKIPPQRELDMLLTAGERISMALLSMALADLGVSAISLTGSQSGILTSGSHGRATVAQIQAGRIEAALAQGKVVIVAGFQGVCPKTKEVTTLGRGGSDLTAVAMAIRLQADSCEIYSDVAGMMTADPRSIANAQVIRRLSWPASEMMAKFGASVLHHRAASLAHRYRLPLSLRSSFDFDDEGTQIIGSRMEDRQVLALTQHRALSLVQVPLVGECQSRILQMVAAGEEPSLVYQVHRSGNGTCYLRALLTERLMDALSDDLATLPGVELTRGLACLTLVGSNFHLDCTLMSNLYSLLGSHAHWIASQAQGLALVVDDSSLESLADTLHQRFVARPS